MSARLSPTTTLFVTVAFALVVGGCNMLTGAGDLTLVYDEGDASGTEGSGGNDQSSGPSGQGLSGQGAGSQGGNGQGGNGEGAGGPLDEMGAVDGVSIDSIVLFQSVERPMMENGQAVNVSTPVVANREGLLRVFYTVDAGYNGQPVYARLSVEGQDPLQVQVTPAGSSSVGNLSTTINFDIPVNHLEVGSGYRVDLLQPIELTSNQNAGARYPSTAGTFAPTEARQAGSLTVTLVPIRYNADGSGRLPDTSPEQLQRYQDLFYAMYPITEIDIQVRNQPLDWNNTASSDGTGWSNLLDQVASLRNNDNAPFNNYYYGIFEPSSSAQSYCSGGCVAGLGFLGGPSDDWSHSAIGLGFTGDMAAETAVHELGHNHGRGHAPCGGVSGADNNYPYGGAALGSWGYNLLTGELYDPGSHVDMMSYCNPTWISDYNFENIFDRVQHVNNAADWFIPQHLQNLTYGQARVEPDGSITWLADVVLERPPVGELTPVTVDTQSGPEQTQASYIRYDHIDGGVLFIPPTAAPVQPGGTFTATVDGFQLQAVTP